ncbi:hypothetical protein [Kribbella italica]|uniref:Uncharacterized protein n=1 Tax=Kribbella italica TaxID=1540520 RepID=A0A7W9JAA3_9ACTN|nr:hypothetical protein [Kribbella italica]MBB5838492.1 hypothetical protein [Kribbella italica]
MIEFSYRKESLPELFGWEHQRDIASATRGELLWYFFPVDILIRDERQEIKTSHAGLPLLNIGLSMIDIIEELSSSESATARYGFLESDDSISFAREGDRAEIRSTLDSVVLTTSMFELSNAIKSSSYRAFGDLISEYPALSQSAVSAEILIDPECF